MLGDLEAEIRLHFEAKNYATAATVALEGYGGEVMGFLHATLRDDELARESFAQLAEDIWRGLPSFAWRCSFRTWMYTLARNASFRIKRGAHKRTVPLSAISSIAEAVASRSLIYLRTEVKDRFAELRESLDADAQALLILRVNKAMGWNEIACVMSEEPLSEAEIKRVAARLRKRFQVIKEEIRSRAEAEHLLDDRELG